MEDTTPHAEQQQDAPTSTRLGEEYVQLIPGLDVDNCDRVLNRPRQGLSERHIGIMAVAGMLGTGIFLTSGRSLAEAGPAGSLLGYIIMGLVTIAVALTAAEMSALSPATGGFIAHAGMFVDPALGAAAGWNFAYALAVVQSVEICACTMLGKWRGPASFIRSCLLFASLTSTPRTIPQVSLWVDAIPQGFLITGFWLSMFALNMMPVRLLGEIEFSFGLIKIALVLLLVVVGLVIDVGLTPSGERIGLKYWHDHTFREISYGDDMVIRGLPGRILAVISSTTNAAFAFAHIQLIAIAGAETRNPRRTIPRALKRTSAGVFALYVSVIFVIGLIIPATHPGLPSPTGTAQSSPFAIAAKEAGIRGLASVINAVVLTSAFSAGVTSIFVSSRSLVALAHESNGPNILLRTDERGVPYVAVIASSSLGALSYLTLGESTAQVFLWLVNLCAVAGLVSWCVLLFTYLRLRKGMAAQGHTNDELVYAAPYQPYLARVALAVCSMTLLFCGVQVFLPHNFTWKVFFASYANIFVFLGLYLIWRAFTGAKPIDPHQMNLRDLLDQVKRDSLSSVQSPPTDYVLLPGGL